MTKEREDVVAAVVKAAGGVLVGRVRLQKIVYLLDQLGLNSAFEYDYHHYGPYSRELDSAVVDAKAFELLEEDFAHRMSDGAMYSSFRLTDAGRNKVTTEAYGNLSPERARELIEVLGGTNVTVLELAATTHWLSNAEGYSDWRREITKRKGRKVENGRLDKAVALLERIGLAPPASAAA